MKSYLNRIPENYKGKPLDLEETLQEQTEEEVLKCYIRAQKRLLNPPIWHYIAGSLSATFKIENKGDADPERLLELGDYISVNIHSPDAVLAGNYDWVQVKEIYEENISDEEAYFLLTLEVAPNPNSNKEQVAHFFKEGATSTFVIYRKHKSISALYFGRNETPNKEDEASTFEKIRNEIVAMGAIAGFSKLQWSALLKSLLQPEL